jgi:hypothetical protein
MNDASSINDPQYWLRRAEETRRIANLIDDAASRDIMHEIAESYERLAAMAEKQPFIGPSE